ncbi:MAG: Nascent polypeptide-associated complex protein [Candidatus Aenigmarchaeota archaeon]|nr:Nascent polypeptide-associated complex protein [Candidatus Aenigmarchaeota archaeon]
MNPKQMQKMMQKMGMNTQDIDAKEVRIICAEKTIIIENPNVQRIAMQGQISFQITGTESEVDNSQLETATEEKETFSDEDIKMIIEQTGKSREEVEKVLEETHDIAETIMMLNK